MNYPDDRKRAKPVRAAERKRRFAGAGKVKAAPRSRDGLIQYDPKAGVEAYLQELAEATPVQRIAVERHGVKGRFIKDLARRMGVPASRMFAMLGVPKATVERKAAADQVVTGAGTIATLGLIRLLAIARDIVEESTAAQAKDFDAAKWLGEWIEIPQAALGGRKASDLIDTPTGVDSVARVLGSIISGSYQ